MAHRILRRSADTDGIAGARGMGRRWLALALVFFSLLSAIMVFSRDVEWRQRRHEARRQGLTAEVNGDFPAARRHFETALAYHPYDWETHLSLAEVLNHRLGDYDNALRHYLYGLAYSPEPAVVEPTRRKISILRLIRAGELEDPRDALADMFLAAEAGERRTFNRRLAANLLPKAPQYLESWGERGRGEVLFSRVLGERDGFFDATVELSFPESGTTMSLHLQCPLRDVWQLSLGFP